MPSAVDYLSLADFEQICRSRADMPRAAKRVGLTEQQVEQIQRGRLRYMTVMHLLYPNGLRVRLDAPMADEDDTPRAPKPGEEGNVTEFGESTWNVWWENGSNLLLLPARDQFTVLGESQWPNRMVCMHTPAGSLAWSSDGKPLVIGRKYTVLAQHGGRVAVADDAGGTYGNDSQPALPAGCFRAAGTVS